MRKIKRLAKTRGISVQVVSKRGKGSHVTLHYGGRRTILQDLKRELPTGTLHAMLEQPELSERDFN